MLYFLVRRSSFCSTSTSFVFHVEISFAFATIAGLTNFYKAYFVVELMNSLICSMLNLAGLGSALTTTGSGTGSGIGSGTG